MKKIIIFLALFASATVNVIAQEVISTAGETQTITGYEISWTLGEPVIETVSTTTNILTQGLQQSKLTVTAVDDLLFSNIEMKVFPNPTSGFITIQTNKFEKGLVYSLFDVSGKRMQSNTISTNETQINLNEYALGTYLLKIDNRTKQDLQTFKIIKN